MRNKGIGGHQSVNNEWLTPKRIIDALGPFDLDPCAPVIRPWETAKFYWTINENGLLAPWGGFTWLNPPYGKFTSKWLARMAIHNDGIVLIFARTETDMFFKYVWNKASCILFLKGRITFHDINGKKALANSGAPSVLIGYGMEAFARLQDCKLKGKFIDLIPEAK
jgi:hypothetical protein